MHRPSPIPIPPVAPRAPMPIMPAHVRDLATFSQMIGQSITDNMHHVSDREPRSKAVQIAKLTSKFSRDEDCRKHIEVFEQVCDSLGERNKLHRSSEF